MGIMDKVKATSQKVGEKAKGAVEAGQEKLDETKTKKHIGELLHSVYEMDYAAIPEVAEGDERYKTVDDMLAEIKKLEKQMKEAAKALEFERAAELRDRIAQLKGQPTMAPQVKQPRRRRGRAANP